MEYTQGHTLYQLILRHMQLNFHTIFELGRFARQADLYVLLYFLFFS